jgi:hypothetical protein
MFFTTQGSRSQHTVLHVLTFPGASSPSIHAIGKNSALKQRLINKACCTFLILLSLWFTANIVQAQDATGKWNFLIEPYLLIPNMDGEVAVRRLPAVDVDADAGDIFGQLKFGAMLYFEAINPKNTFVYSSDLIYMDLEQDVESGLLINSGNVSSKQVVWELAALARLALWLDIGIGGRIVSLESKVELQTINGSESGSINKLWVDPIVIVRSQGVVHENWLLSFRGDLGGFGMGSDFTWQLQPNVGYKVSKLFQVSAGYRLISINYRKGSGGERFVHDVLTYGPVVRLGFDL